MLASQVVAWRQSKVVSYGSRQELARSGQFSASLAVTDLQRDAVFQLRFKVFNLELKEGLDSAFACGRDVDEFDDVCDHVMIEDARGEVVGTYRVQPGAVAAGALGFYSAREFEFAPYKELAPQIIELGRACIHREYRTYEVLALLWRAVAIYAMRNNARYLIGCSSVTSQDPGVGWTLYERLRPHEVSAKLKTFPTRAFELPWSAERNIDTRIPKLLRGYLGMGAKICGPPALDREFKTLDFLTFLDIQAMSPTARTHFFQCE